MIELPAGRFHYLSWGAERAELPAIVLLHGITSSAQSWVRVGPALADRYCVYALDMRGHGDSIKPIVGEYSLRHTADDAAAFIDALELERPVVIGHSWGGATAMVLASGAGSQKPVPQLAQVILEDPAHTFGHGNPEERAAFYTEDIGRSAEVLRPEITSSSPGWTSADIEGKIDALQKVTREAVVSVFAEAGQAGELLPLFVRIATPTLVIRADATLGTTLNETDWEQVKPARAKLGAIDWFKMRQVAEQALIRARVRAVFADEGHRLMQGDGSHSVDEQLEWLKSLSNRTKVLHVLAGPYALFGFRNTSGQLARRGRDIHFARYQVENKEERIAFVAALKYLLERVPLEVDLNTSLSRWRWWATGCVGCIGVLRVLAG